MIPDDRCSSLGVDLCIPGLLCDGLRLSNDFSFEGFVEA